MRPLWGMEGVAGAFRGVGAHGRVNRALVAFLGVLGLWAGARGEGGQPEKEARRSHHFTRR